MRGSHSRSSLALTASLLALASSSALARAGAVPGAPAQTGVQVNTHPLTGLDVVGDAGNEPTLAVSPTNPLEIVIGWRDFPTTSSNSRFAGYAWSNDGGLTFTSGGQLAKPPGIPNAEQTDPVLSVDANGNFHYWSEVFRPSFSLWHYQSNDGGQTWPAVHPVEAVPSSGDKDWMTIDRTGGIGDGNVYGGWNNFSLGGHCFVRSLDGGLTFSSPVRIADQGGTQWMMQFAVGPAGEVYAAWRNYNQNAIYVTKSLTARDPNVANPAFDALGGGGQSGLDVMVDQSNDPGFPNINPVGFHQLYLAVDHSSGPSNGFVYLVWADDRNDGSDVYFARSEDGGFTWITGTRINDDALANGEYQWMPAMSVAPNGRIDVVWYDTRNDPGNPVPYSELYYAFSLDSGDTWSVNRRASDSFDTSAGFPSQDKIGDYIQSWSETRDLSVAYAATFAGGQDVWYLRLEPTTLDLRNVVAAQTATALLAGGRPNQNAWLAGTASGLGTFAVPQLNVTMGLDNPQLLGVAQTDAFGAASWNVNVPGNLQGLTVWAQAIQLENGSNVASAVVQ